MAEPPGTGGPLIEFQSKSELVYSRLHTAIMSGQLKPGDRVVADALARELRVSKIPIREALSRLESEGLIIQSHHAGARVAPLSLHEMRGVFLLRQEIEGLAARVAASQIDQPTLDELAEVHQEMAATLKRGALPALTDLNRRFHVLIAKATTYTTIVDATESTLRQVHRYRVAITRVASAWSSAVEEHGEILHALQARDQRRAESAARQHAAHQLEVELGAELVPDMFIKED